MADHTDGAPLPDPQVRLGQVVGSYRLVRALGQGSMGQVYEALHEGIGRRVAVKIIDPRHCQAPQALERFLNEARLVNEICHPGIVEIYDHLPLPGGAAALVMELLRGETLAHRMRQLGPLPVELVLRLVRQMASAMAAAHERGYVHRDLKPDNVMLITDPESGWERTKILDFGVARMIPGLTDPGWQVQTRVGLVLGTPQYMAPEQCQGIGPFTDRLDCYALGIVLYEMLSGAPPFVAEGLGALMSQHLFTQAPDLLERVSGVPPGLGDLVHQLLSKKAVDRPSMREVLRIVDELHRVSPAPGQNQPALPGKRPQGPPIDQTEPSMGLLPAQTETALVKRLEVAPVAPPEARVPPIWEQPTTAHPVTRSLQQQPTAAHAVTPNLQQQATAEHPATRILERPTQATRIFERKDPGPSLTLWAQASNVLPAGEWQEPDLPQIPRRRALAVIAGTCLALAVVAAGGSVALRRPVRVVPATALPAALSPTAPPRTAPAAPAALPASLAAVKTPQPWLVPPVQVPASSPTAPPVPPPASPVPAPSAPVRPVATPLPPRPVATPLPSRPVATPLPGHRGGGAALDEFVLPQWDAPKPQGGQDKDRFVVPDWNTSTPRRPAGAQAHPGTAAARVPARRSPPPITRSHPVETDDDVEVLR